MAASDGYPLGPCFSRSFILIQLPMLANCNKLLPQAI